MNYFFMVLQLSLHNNYVQNFLIQFVGSTLFLDSVAYQTFVDS